MHPKTRAIAALAALALGACEQTTASLAADLSAAEAAALAPLYEELASDELGALGVPAYDVSAGAAQREPVTVTTTFTRSLDCPRGGSVQVQGTLVRTGDREARSATHQYAATRTEQACAFGVRGGTITISGNPDTDVTGSWSVTAGVAGVRTVTHLGAFTWARSGGGSGACGVNLTATWDPATRTHRVQGTFCGRPVDVTRTRA